MKFEEVLPVLREGKKIRRTSWQDRVTSMELVDSNCVRIEYKDIMAQPFNILTIGDVTAEDWEIL